jgi:crotonobetainyl-CoA:carnitine CoA-transferase CaiB-like acyl-CoA transferase
MTNSNGAALSDIRVLDLTDHLGSYCTKLLADLGADVIKIEAPAGDPTRRLGPFFHDQVDPEKSLLFFNLNTSKRSVVLDLDDERDCEVLRELVPTADIVVESHPPGYLASRGLGYNDLANLKPDIIVTSITGFGQDGPHAGYLAPDIVGVAMAGIMWLAGDPADPPNLPYGAQGYLSASIRAAGGALMALYHRDLTGEGQHVDVSMQEALLIAQETAMQSYDLTKAVRGRSGARGALPITVPGMGPYEATDGWIWGYVGAPGGAPWPELLALMEAAGQAEDLGEEPYASTIGELNLRFLTGLVLDPQSGKEKAPVLNHIDEVLARFCASNSKWSLYEEGQGRRLLIGIVSTPEDLAKNPQLAARNWYQDIAHDDLGATLRYPGPPYRLSETPWRIARRPPRLGEHTDDVLQQAGELQREERAPQAAPEVRQDQPLAGVKVADFSWFGAGPICAQDLAVYGATVVRVESESHLDGLRIVGPFPTGKTGYNVSGYFNNYNINKLGLTLNLNTEKGRELALRLVAWSDVFITNMTPRIIERWGLTYDELLKVRPDIIAAYQPMQGFDGPHRDFLGFGAVLGPITGFNELCGYPARAPAGLGTNYPDYVINPGHTLVAILAALRHRRATGRGQRIELAQLESSVAALAPAVMDYTVNGRVQTRAGNRLPHAAPHGAFRCQSIRIKTPFGERDEDRWCVIACFSDEQWSALRTAMGDPEWAREPRFDTLGGRKAIEDDLERGINEWTSQRSPEDVMATLQEAGVPAGVVQNGRDCLEDEHLKARDYYVYLDHPEAGRTANDGPGFRLSKTPAQYRTPSPCLGEHNERVCKEILGLTDDDIADLLVEQVLH